MIEKEKTISEIFTFLKFRNEILKRKNLIQDYKLEVTTDNYSFDEENKKINLDIIIHQSITPIEPIKTLNIKLRHMLTKTLLIIL